MNYCLQFNVGDGVWLMSNANTFAQLFDGRFEIADTDFYRVTQFIYLKIKH